MDFNKVYVSLKDFPVNVEEVINDILKRLYSKKDTNTYWDNAADFLSWDDESYCEEFVFLSLDSEGVHWDLDGGSANVVKRRKLTEQVDFPSWYAAIKEKFEI